MKKVLNIFLGSIALLSSISCTKEFLDINTNPLTATTASADLLFPEAIVNISSSRTIELNAINIQGQQWASGGSAGVFSNPERYTISTFTTGNTWSDFYTEGLKNLFLVRQDAEAAGNVNTVAQTKILESFIYLNLTLIWEDVPFTESVNPDFPTPTFDSQETVLKGIVSRIDEAQALFDDNDEIRASTGDLIYGGDLDNWKRFGNSLKLKTLMIIANKDASVASQIQSLVTQPLILDNSQEASLKYSTTIGSQNPIWKTLDNFAGGSNAFWFAGKTLVDLMNGLNDPRRATYFDDVNGDYVGVAQGDFSYPDATSSFVSLNIMRPDFPDRYITASETLLFLAEAAAKGYISGGLSDADMYLRQGVQASMDFYDGKPGEIATSDKTDYLNSLPDLSTLTTDAALKEIYEQQYIDLFTRGVSIWTNWRRTKTPTFELPNGALLGDIIRRYPYPNDEAGANPNTPSSSPLDSPMWFEN